MQRTKLARKGDVITNCEIDFCISEKRSTKQKENKITIATNGKLFGNNNKKTATITTRANYSTCDAKHRNEGIRARIIKKEKKIPKDGRMDGRTETESPKRNRMSKAFKVRE